MKKKSTVVLLAIFLSQQMFAQDVRNVFSSVSDNNGRNTSANNKQIEIPPTIKSSLEYLGNVCFDKSTDSAFYGTSYYTTLLFQAYLTKAQNSNAISSNSDSILLNWYELLTSSALNNRQRAEILWVLGGANLINDYSIKNYALGENSNGMIILDEKFLNDNNLMTEAISLLQKINRPPHASELSKFDGNRATNLRISKSGFKDSPENDNDRLKLAFGDEKTKEIAIKNIESREAGNRVAATYEMATIDNIVSQLVSRYISDARSNGLESQGAYGAVVPITGYSKYINTPFRQALTRIDKAKTNLLETNIFTDNTNALNASAINVSKLYDYLDVVSIKMSNGKIVPFGKLWNESWKTIILKGLKNEDAFSDIDNISINNIKNMK
jgi:hypothetical protein